MKNGISKDDLKNLRERLPSKYTNIIKQRCIAEYGKDYSENTIYKVAAGKFENFLILTELNKLAKENEALLAEIKQ